MSALTNIAQTVLSFARRIKFDTVMFLNLIRGTCILLLSYNILILCIFLKCFVSCIEWAWMQVVVKEWKKENEWFMLNLLTRPVERLIVCLNMKLESLPARKVSQWMKYLWTLMIVYFRQYCGNLCIFFCFCCVTISLYFQPKWNKEAPDIE